MCRKTYSSLTKNKLLKLNFPSGSAIERFGVHFERKRKCRPSQKVNQRDGRGQRVLPLAISFRPRSNVLTGFRLLVFVGPQLLCHMQIPIREKQTSEEYERSGGAVAAS